VLEGTWVLTLTHTCWVQELQRITGTPDAEGPGADAEGPGADAEGPGADAEGPGADAAEDPNEADGSVDSDSSTDPATPPTAAAADGESRPPPIGLVTPAAAIPGRAEVSHWGGYLALKLCL
jgi:hypothetical protein